MLVLVLTMATDYTFSWYDRYPTESETGNMLSYIQTGKVNNSVSQDRTVQTFAGTMNNGVITYSNTAVSGAVTVKPGEACYFKTVITDNAGVGASVVSLFVKKITVSSNLTDSIYIGLVGSEKTYERCSGNNYQFNNVCIEDNIYVANNATVEVYWFVKSNATFTSDGTVTLDAQYLVYN